MTIRHGAAEFQASAADYHDRAARYHEEAARHHKSEKDQANAAYDALAINAFVLPFNADGALPDYFESIDPFPAGLAYPETRPTGAEHHIAAADHYDQAARHHELAARHWEEKNYQFSIQEASAARRHAQCANFHGDEAAIAEESRMRAHIAKK